MLLIFATALCYLIPILLPINYSSNSQTSNTTAKGLDKFSCLNIPPTESTRFWAHLATAYIFVGWTCWWIRHETLSFISRDRTSVTNSQCTYILIDIPRAWSDQNLFEFIRRFEVGELCFQIVRDVGFNRFSKQLTTQAEKIEKEAARYLFSKSRLEAQSRAERTKNRWCVPLTEKRCLPKLEHRVTELSKTCEMVFNRRHVYSENSSLRTAIITLTGSRKSIVVECGIMRPASAYYVNRSLSDLVWANAARPRAQRRAMSIGAGSLALIASLVFAIPLSFSGLLAQITYVARETRWLHGLSSVSPWALSYLQGVLPQVILGCVVAVAPPLLRQLAKYHGHVTLLQAQLSFQNYYFLFLFLQAFLLVTLSSSLSTIASTIIHEPGAIPRMLAMSIPKGGNYFMSYITLQGLSLAAETLSLWKRLLTERIMPYFKTMTPRTRGRSEHDGLVDLPTLYPLFTIIGVVGKSLI